MHNVSQSIWLAWPLLLSLSVYDFTGSNKFNSIRLSPFASQTILQSPPTAAAGLDLIRRQRYDEAITCLEQTLESHPKNSDALSYLATAHLYQSLDFMKARADFEAAFNAGGGATFYVTHSHEKISTDDIVDYCRGWLHLRQDGVEFAPAEGTHGFKLKYSEIEEFKQNHLSKAIFHIKTDGKSQNFRGRTSRELETLLIVALYKKFSPKVP
jgi:tetratricopeptide (TPR) repeat protein